MTYDTVQTSKDWLKALTVEPPSTVLYDSVI